MALAIPGKSALQERGIPDCILGYLIIAQNSCFVQLCFPRSCEKFSPGLGWGILLSPHE